jgi:hypothetical protein
MIFYRNPLLVRLAVLDNSAIANITLQVAKEIFKKD